MKKSLIAMIAAALCISSAMAQVLIYDYAVSFKKVETTSKTFKPSAGLYAGNPKVHYDSPKVKSDKLTGYVVVRACDDCFKTGTVAVDLGDPQSLSANGLVEDFNGMLKPMLSSRFGDNSLKNEGAFLDSRAVAPSEIIDFRGADLNGDAVRDSDNVAVVYIRRPAAKKEVYRAVGAFAANMFGAQTALLKDEFGNEIESWYMDKVTDASAMLTYPMFWNGYVDMEKMLTFNWLGNGGVGLHTFIPDTTAGGVGFGGVGDYPYGYYGIETNWCYNGGYGKVTKVSSTVTSTGCIPVSNTSTCFAVKSLSGSMLAAGRFDGVCSSFLFDLCDDNDNSIPAYFGPAKEDDQVAPIPGTYTLKLNNAMSFNGKDFRYNTFAQAEDAIEKKLGVNWEAGDVLYIPWKDLTRPEKDRWDGNLLNLREGFVY